MPRVIVVPSAHEELNELALPADQIDEIVLSAAKIAELNTTGFRVPFSHPPAEYYDIGKVRMVYRIHDQVMEILQFLRM